MGEREGAPMGGWAGGTSPGGLELHLVLLLLAGRGSLGEGAVLGRQEAEHVEGALPVGEGRGSAGTPTRG